MIVPERAIVRPRAVSPDSGQTLPLEELVSALLEENSRGRTDRPPVIQITGGPGSGKTTALAHLAAVLPPQPAILFLDDVAPLRSGYHQPVIVAHSKREPQLADAVLELAPWTEDDFIEYLLAAHPTQCGSVLARIRASLDFVWLEGCPELWWPVLELMAADESLVSMHVAIRRVLSRCILNEGERRGAGEYCLALLTNNETVARAALSVLDSLRNDAGRFRIFRHSTVQLAIAADWLCESILLGVGPKVISQRLPRELVREVARQIRDLEPAKKQLRRILATDEHPAHPMAASLLAAADYGWRPTGTDCVYFQGGYFSGVNWPNVIFGRFAVHGSSLTRADFSAATLSAATLNHATAFEARFRGANLRLAKMEHFAGIKADFSSADLRGVTASHARFNNADFSGAILNDAELTGVDFGCAKLVVTRFRGANLTGASLLGANIEHADFQGANLTRANLRSLPLRLATLTGATFPQANLSQCDLEDVDLPDANFHGALLFGSLLTGSKLPRANFAKANLTNAGLAEVDWEQADLREADLRGCSFHLGSTRSGLVNSPIACEGSKTGFYTDEYLDQAYKHPEEIRKANLCGADLRGANLTGVDFYLVDLRGAKYDPEIQKHLERCGAILYDRSRN